MEARFRTRMDRSLDEIAAEMHSAQAGNPFSQEFEERAFVGAEHTLQRSSNSRRYTPYPEPYSLDREDSSRMFSTRNAQAVSGSSEPTNRLFIGNLNFSTSWQSLKEHMRRAGPVHKCDIFTEASGKSKGMGLVQYESADSAERALLELQESVLDGRRLFLRKHMDPVEREKAGYKSRHTVSVKPPPNPAATVFVQNLDYSVTWQKLKDVLKVAGKIVSVDLAKDRDGKSKGFASVQFSEPTEAINAIALFHGQMLSDRPMKLKMHSSAPYQPDPMQLRLSGLAGVAPGMQATPPPPPPPPQPSYTHQSPPGEAPSLSSLNVPFLSAVISSLTAEKLAAILIQNSTLGPSSIIGASSAVPHQSLGTPSVPHMYPSYPPLTSLPASEVSKQYGTEKHSGEHQVRSAARVDPVDDLNDPTLNQRIANGEFYNTPSPQSCKVFIGNLNFNTTWHFIRNLFKGAGPVRHVEIFKNSAGKSKGCGIVIYYDSQSALRAIRMFNNMHVDGRKLFVQRDRSLSTVDT